MRAYRADFRSLVSFINISAVVAFPAERSFVFESFSFTVVIKQLLIALFVSGLYLGYAAEFSGKFGKAVFFCFLSHTFIHICPLVIFSCSGVSKIFFYSSDSM